MKHRRFLRKNFGATLFFSYLILLILSVTALLMQMGSSLRELEKNTEEFSRIALSQIGASMERAYDRILDQASQIHARPEYDSLLNASGSLNSFKLLKVGKLEEEMVRQVSHSSYITGISVWFERPEVAATTMGFARTSDGFEQMLRRSYGIGLDEVKDMARRRGLTLRQVSASRLLAVICNGRSSLYPDRDWESILLMELDRAAFLSPLNGGDDEDTSAFWAITPEGETLFPGAQDRDFAGALTEAAEAPGHISRVPYEGKDYAVMAARTRDGLELYSAVDFSSWSETQRRHMGAVLISCAVYLLLGLVTALLFSRGNAQPVERLSGLLSQKLSGDPKEGDLANLEAGIQSLLRYWQEYARARSREEKGQAEQLVFDVLSGAVRGREMTEAMARYDLRFPSETFAAAVLAVRNLSSAFLAGRAPDDRESYEIARVAAASVAGELLGECGAAYACRHDGRVWVLVSLSPEKASGAGERLLAALSRTAVFLREEIGVETGAYLTQCVSSAENLPAAYREAVWAVEQIEGYGIPGTVYDLAAVERYLSPKTPGALSVGDPEKRRRFFSAVAAGDLEEARQLYLELRQQDLALSDGSFEAVRVQTSVLMGYLISNLPPALRERFSGELEEFTRTVRLEHRDEDLIEEMGRFMARYGEIYRERESGEEKNSLSHTAVQYINDRFSDRDVSVTSVAEDLGVSPSYLSRVFRRDVGMSVLDYIHERRIETAKLLLRESDLTVEGVAGRCGFTGALALIRAFRKAEGCTPTEYRKGLKRED